MEECKTADTASKPCPNFYPRIMKKKKAAKKNAEKSHQFEIEPCKDGFKFLAMDNTSMEALNLYLVFDGSYLEDSYQLMRLYELEAMEDDTKACLVVAQLHLPFAPSLPSTSPD